MMDLKTKVLHKSAVKINDGFKTKVLYKSAVNDGFENKSTV